MATPLYLIDAFTDRPFGGNPAAVCLLDRPAETSWMQSVAEEMNLSETAFVCPNLSSDGYSLRWFTPTTEVDLCGHATLAAAHALWDAGRLRVDQPAEFETRSGTLRCTRTSSGWIEMDFPATPAQVVASREKPTAEPWALTSLSSALAVDIVALGRSAFDWIVEVEAASDVRSLRPDFTALANIDCRGVIVTAASDDPAHHFVSRFFAPRVGIDEDPVTGSAHCCLGPWWGERLKLDSLVAYQASKRGGVVRMTLRGDRVVLAGKAVTVLRGSLNAEDAR